MKTFERPAPKPAPAQEAPKEVQVWHCILGPHKADVLHRGTAYCRSCYDERNRLGTLLDQ